MQTDLTYLLLILAITLGVVGVISMLLGYLIRQSALRRVAIFMLFFAAAASGTAWIISKQAISEEKTTDDLAQQADIADASSNLFFVPGYIGHIRVGLRSDATESGLALSGLNMKDMAARREGEYGLMVALRADEDLRGEVYVFFLNTEGEELSRTGQQLSLQKGLSFPMVFELKDPSVFDQVHTAELGFLKASD